MPKEGSLAQAPDADRSSMKSVAKSVELPKVGKDKSTNDLTPSRLENVQSSKVEPSATFLVQELFLHPHRMPRNVHHVT